MKNILVTTDLSEKSKSAFDYARKFASAFGAKVHLLAIIEDPGQAALVYAMDFPILPDTEVQKQLRDKVAAELEVLVESEFKNMEITAEVVEATGPVSTEILRYAKENDIELIVMATHGRTGISRMLIGSITERVLREASCPIVTIPVRD